MSVANLTAEQFEETLANHEMLVIDFWAAWCGPCKFFAPIFEQAAGRHPEIAFAKVNVDEEQQLAGMFQVRSIPTIAFMREGIVIYAHSGALQASELDEILTKVKELDMAQVHADMAAQQAQG
jgi:thioredoxin 1